MINDLLKLGMIIEHFLIKYILAVTNPNLSFYYDIDKKQKEL